MFSSEVQTRMLQVFFFYNRFYGMFSAKRTVSLGARAHTLSPSCGMISGLIRFVSIRTPSR